MYLWVECFNFTNTEIVNQAKYRTPSWKTAFSMSGAFFFFFASASASASLSDGLVVTPPHPQGTLRVLLVLLHDFPEFLCDYHYGFCDVIPPNCIQLRNLILSAFPRNMRLPDPFTPNLKVRRPPARPRSRSPRPLN